MPPCQQWSLHSLTFETELKIDLLHNVYKYDKFYTAATSVNFPRATLFSAVTLKVGQG